MLSNHPNVLGGAEGTSVPAGEVPVGGPGTSTDNAFARWDGTSGNAIQDSSGSTLSDTGDATFAGDLTVAGGDITGGAGNMVITSGTGNSRTLTLRTTTSGGTATSALAIDATQNVNVSTGELQTAGNRVGYNLSAYGAGTAYSFTNSAAAIDFGTTDPVKVIDKAGTYLVLGQVHLSYNGATVTTQTATIKVRRTNNTATDLSAVVVIDLPVATTLTHTLGIFQIPPFVYTTAATDDSVTIFGNVNASLGAGTLDATAIGTSLVFVRLY